LAWRILDVFARPITLEKAKLRLADISSDKVEAITSNLSALGFRIADQGCTCVSLDDDLCPDMVRWCNHLLQNKKRE
jgi:hypothetical protein